MEGHAQDSVDATVVTSNCASTLQATSKICLVAALSVQFNYSDRHLDDPHPQPSSPSPRGATHGKTVLWESSVHGLLSAAASQGEHQSWLETPPIPAIKPGPWEPTDDRFSGG